MGDGNGDGDGTLFFILIINIRVIFNGVVGIIFVFLLILVSEFEDAIDMREFQGFSDQFGVLNEFDEFIHRHGATHTFTCRIVPEHSPQCYGILVYGRLSL